MENSAQKSSILLLNLGLDTDKSAIKSVGVAELKQIFGDYGTLKKIIVFTRKVLLKAFVEYEDTLQAERAKDALHNTVVGNYGKARLYFSPMERLEFSNKYLEFWEDKEAVKALPLDDDVSTKHSFKNSLSKISHQFSFRKENCAFAAQENKNARCTSGALSNITDVSRFNFSKNSSSINRNLFAAPQHCYNSLVPRTNAEQALGFTELPVNAGQQDTYANGGQASCVVLVSNLGFVFKNTDELFNIFSAFGNIVKILYMVNLQKAMIEYSEPEYAAMCINNLSDFMLGETKLHISFSKYKTINLEKSGQNENSAQYNQVLVVPQVRNRYSSKSLCTTTPISSTLLISFLKNGRAQTIDVYLAIERICKPTKTKLVGKSNAKEDSSSVSMLFSFGDIQSAVYVMYKCHNAVVKGALLDIFFF